MNEGPSRYPERRRARRPWWPAGNERREAAPSSTRGPPCAPPAALSPVAAFDPTRRRWCRTAADAPCALPLPPLAGSVTIAGLEEAPDALRHAVARLRPGEVQDIISMMRFAHEHGIRIGSVRMPAETIGDDEAWLLVDQRTRPDAG